MTIVKKSAALILAATWAVACAAPTDADDDGDDGNTSTGPAVPTNTGGGTGVTTTTGGTTGVATGGTTGVPTGGTTGVSTGGTTTTPPATATPCGNGTVVATSPPTVLAWETQTGSGASESTETAAGPVTLAADPMGTSDPYVSAVMSTWAESGRECVDLSGFTGVQFTVTGTASDLFFKISVSGSDPSGHCADGCYDHPSATISATGAPQTVDFGTLAPGGWGNGSTFGTGNQAIALNWITTDKNANFTVSDVSFY